MQKRFPDLDKFSFQNPVLDKDITSPPGSPARYDRYLIIGIPTGAWEGNQNNITEFNGTSWIFITKKEGMLVYVKDEKKYYYYDGFSWAELPGGGGGSGDMEKAVYDTNDNGIVDKAESVDDGVNSATAEEVKNAVDKSHDQNTDTVLQCAGEELDQQQLSYGYYYNIKTSDREGFGQTFTPSKSGNLTTIKLRISRTTTNNYDFILKLYNTVGGIPSGVVLGTIIKAYTEFGTSFSEITFTFEIPIVVIKDTLYAFTCEPSILDDTKYYNVDAVNGDNYSNGTVLEKFDGNWSIYTGDDAYFKIYINIPSTDLINNGTLRTNLLVDEGIKIDGRDISEDGTKLDTVEENAVSLATVKVDPQISEAINNIHSFEEDPALQCFVVIK